MTSKRTSPRRKPIDLSEQFPGDDWVRLTAYVRYHQSSSYTLNGMPLVHHACANNVASLIDACLLTDGAIQLKHRGQLPLHTLMNANDVTRPLHLDPFIAAGVDLNARDCDGNTPLHILVLRMVVLNRDLTAPISQLLAHNVDPNCSNQYGRTPLMMSVQNYRHHGDELKKLRSAGFNFSMTSYPKLADLLLRYGADPHPVDVDGHTALALVFIDELDGDVIDNNAMNRIRSAALLLRAGARGADALPFITDTNVSEFMRAWHDAEEVINPEEKVNTLVSIMAHQGPLAAWAAERLSALAGREPT